MNKNLCIPTYYISVGQRSFIMIPSSIYIHAQGTLTISRHYVDIFCRPGKARSCTTNTVVIHFLYDLLVIFPKLYFSTPILLTVIFNLEGHQNRCIGSKVTTILLNVWILPTGGAASGRVCACNLRSRLVLPVNWTS